MMRRIVKFWLVFMFATYLTLMACIILFLFSTFMARVAGATDYAPAVDKAREAFMKQSGIQAHVDKATEYAEREARGNAYSLFGKTVTDVAAFSGYTLYKREVTVKNFQDPILPGAPTHSIQAAPGAAFLSTTWRF